MQILAERIMVISKIGLTSMQINTNLQPLTNQVVGSFGQYLFFLDGTTILSDWKCRICSTEFSKFGNELMEPFDTCL